MTEQRPEWPRDFSDVLGLDDSEANQPWDWSRIPVRGREDPITGLTKEESRHFVVTRGGDIVYSGAGIA